MDKKKMIKKARNPNFISGIYNYCDRWCERCSFTSRCLLYDMEQEEYDDPATRDLNNEAFWQKLQSIFQQTLEMVRDLAEEQGVDLSSIDVESEMQKEEKLREVAESHKLAQAALRYSNIVENWFKSEQKLFEQKEDELNTKLDWGLDKMDLNSEVKNILDAVEIIRWYQHQIYVKLMRALVHDDIENFEEERNFPKDSDGSVKVALIGMDRSISAWGILHNHFPEKTDEILTILLHLDRLRRATEKEFPDARSFVRPGFDTIGNLNR